MGLMFTVVGKTNDPELLAEERYYQVCALLGIDCQVATKKSPLWHDYYQRQQFMPHIPAEYRNHFIHALKEAA